LVSIIGETLFVAHIVTVCVRAAVPVITLTKLHEWT